ncbi:MAG: thiamine-phosphate kinase [bacterium]
MNLLKNNTETVADAGEDGILDLVSNVFPVELLKPAGVVIPTFYDDAAVLGSELIGQDEELVITSDVLVEGADFLLEWMSYFDLGYKSLMVNLSDIAAMGAKPLGMIVVVGLPDETPMMQLESFLEGMKEVAVKHSVILLGGDLSESKMMFCNITVLGVVPKGTALQRGGACENDVIAVTGYPGEARAGLMIALNKVSNVRSEERTLLNPFFRPVARIDAGLALREIGGVRGCLDLSDGIARDAGRIAKRNNVRVEITAENFPMTDKLRIFWESRGRNPYKEVASGGEDFELMFCCDESRFDEVRNCVEKKTGLKVTRIGKVMKGDGAVLVMPDGTILDMRTWGFDHFEKSESEK